MTARDSWSFWIRWGVPGNPNDGPGAVRLADEARAEDDAPPDSIELTVRSESRRVIRVTSHYPFERVNSRLIFDRDAARGFRLDIPAGATERWSPGETRTVRLVRFAGEGGADATGDTG